MLLIFFCLTANRGTEGIKHVKNFVAFLALYRAFFGNIWQQARCNYVVYIFSL
jgi:hypothetical protein